MTTNVIDIICTSLNLVYPDRPCEWIERAAKEMFRFTDQNPNATQEQRIELDRRIQNMCTTGKW